MKYSCMRREINSEAVAISAWVMLRPSLTWQLWTEKCKGESITGLGDRLDLKSKGIE